MKTTISWKLSQPFSTARLYEAELGRFVPFSKDILAINMGVRKGDRIALLYNNDEVLLTAPIKGGQTLHDVLRSLEKGMQTPLTTLNQIQVAYQMIGYFFKPSDRLRLVKRLEQKKLTPGDLVKDNYEFFEGNLRRTGNIWIYAVGS